MNSFGDASGRGRVVQAGHDDGEFVAAEPREHLAVVEDAAGAAGDRLQKRVAGGMPEEVVDLLEAVEVEAEQREPAAGRDAAAAISRSSLLLKLRRLGRPVSASCWARCRRSASACLRARTSRTAIAWMRPAGKTHRAADEFDRDHAALGMAQARFRSTRRNG